MVRDGTLLWTPSPERIAGSNLTAFMNWLRETRGHVFANHAALWQWSVDDLEGFWQAIWDYFEVQSSSPVTQVLAERRMPGAKWFSGACLNYAQHALRHERPDAQALMYGNERTGLESLTWQELGAQVRILATRLRNIGVSPGDRVVAYLPNIPEAMVALLATASIGAVWASCGPDFGTRGVLDRFAQLEPKVLICVDGYQYGGQPFDRKPEVRKIIAELGSLRHVIYLPYLHPQDREPPSPHTLFWSELLQHPAVAPGEFQFAQVAFDHPLWILFSSGTTGLPKAICHGHGGIILEQQKHVAFDFDAHAGQRLLVFTSTGWMMWNVLASSLLCDVVPVLYDGSPTWPSPQVLWKLVEDSGSSVFGTSPTYISAVQRSGFVPQDGFGLARLRSMMLTGSPVTPECMAWIYANVKQDLWVACGSGGTDVCTGFVVGVSILPVRAGEIQGRSLGAAVYAFDEHGEKVLNQVGELVVTEPMPSMPIRFWNDDGNRRYLQSYFQQYPGVWRHGDFLRINERGGCCVLGRSDATLNRHGVRIGTAEIYRSLAALEEIDDALIVNLDLPDGGSFMPLFVKLRDGVTLDAALAARIRDTLRREYSPRHVPDRIHQVAAIPYTLTGKKMEVPVRRILMGAAAERAASRDAVANPQALDFFSVYAREQTDYTLPG